MKRAEVLLSLGAVLLAASYLIGNTSAMAAGIAVIVHYSLARMAFKPKLKVKRRIPEKAMEKEPVKALVTVENLSDMRGTVRVRESSKKVFARELRVQIRPGEKKALEQTLLPLSKGRVTVSAEATFEDELGLFMREFPVEENGEMTVFPSVRSIREAMRERKHVDALAEAEKALGIGAETLEFEELREFLPGDDTSKIDWKATSRLQKAIVRIFRRETLADVYLLINVDRKFRRELKAGKVDYLALIISQLAIYFRKFGHPIKVIAYDESGIVKSLEHVHDPLLIVHELGLKPEEGHPPLRPSSLSRHSSFGRLIMMMRRKVPASGPLKAALKVSTGAYVIVVDDIGLHPREVINAAKILQRKGSNVVMIYPNPILFIERESLNRGNIESIYQAYRERKTLMRKASGWLKIIEVGPADVLPRVVRKL